MENYAEFLTRRESIIKGWPITSSPMLVLLIVKMYLLFALAIGPWIMKRREPIVLKKVLLIYNAAQVIFNIWLCHLVDIRRFWHYVAVPCRYIPDTEYESALINMSWWFTVNKLVDFFDTLFIILRKRHDQLNLLHLYHHPSTFVISWLHLRYGPGIYYIISWYINAVIHIIMYTYYFLAGLGPRYQKYLWWKKYLTRLQMLQFCILLFYLIWTAFCCKFSVTMFILNGANPAILLFLFSRFYFKTYKKKSKSEF